LKKDYATEKPKVELKVLPSHVKYAFLEENDVKPVMISNDLSLDEEAQLV